MRKTKIKQIAGGQISPELHQHLAEFKAAHPEQCRTIFSAMAYIVAEFFKSINTNGEKNVG